MLRHPALISPSFGRWVFWNNATFLTSDQEKKTKKTPCLFRIPGFQKSCKQSIFTIKCVILRLFKSKLVGSIYNPDYTVCWKYTSLIKVSWLDCFQYITNNGASIFSQLVVQGQNDISPGSDLVKLDAAQILWFMYFELKYCNIFLASSVSGAF